VIDPDPAPPAPPQSGRPKEALVGGASASPPDPPETPGEIMNQVLRSGIENRMR
jgi:hypothetical protein